MAIPIFSNKPRFSTKQLSLEATLDLPKFNAMTQSSLENSSGNNISAALAAACGDPNMGTTFIQNVVHQVINLSGRPIELNFFMEAFGSEERMVNTKRFWNHYMGDTSLNIYPANGATATGPGLPFEFQVLKQMHGSSGGLSFAAEGYSLWDKDNMLEYIITNVDRTIPYGNKVMIIPVEANVTGSILANTAYLITPGRRVGGESCQQVTNQMSTIGYSQEVNFLRVRRDWEVAIDLLRAYRDKIQYPVIYDINGNPMDSWDIYEAMEAREGLRMALNLAGWIGTPTTNQALISGVGAVMDQDHTGFYGMLPSIMFGGGVVYDFPQSVGFDFEADGEPLFLWQDSRKQTTRFMVRHGLAFDFTKNDRSNKLVANTQVGGTIWEAYKRLEAKDDGYTTGMAKMKINSYKYNSFELDFMLWGALSDLRYAGSDYFSNLAVMIPEEGARENGKQIPPMEFYQYGQNGWTGDYEEFYVDNRKQSEACETIQGYCAQSLAFAMHGPDLFILLNPVKAA
jgi:hypothetical protein